eukprot:gnl/MRDRNA2_/MRDRNA2_24119_c0_seq1.p1 gnl/MRDRNA2_/MRDRNA2_24119_c0~~gnl/MRDRNA2_/MRDRNA2_24119_c0_seq1.p1  ORF type:complete len:162 (+),score=21.81 gnl/MRDRNA2_/MRDRNA2_24119_c0_seq1:60-545(+)
MELAGSQLILQFAERWGLDKMSIRYLYTLSPEQIAVVLQDFNPPSDTRNVNAKLAVFIKSMTTENRQGLQTSMPDTSMNMEMLQEFVGRWQFDQKAINALRSLSPSDMHKVMTSFAPSADTTNVNARLMKWIGFVTSESGGGGGGKGGREEGGRRRRRRRG